MNYSLGFLMASLLMACGQAPQIVEKLLPDTCSKPRGTGAKVDVIVLHFSSNVLEKPQAPYEVEAMLRLFQDKAVSAHYLIGREGTIYRLVPEDQQAFHAGEGELPWGSEKRKNSLNNTSIGIEILAIGTQEEMKVFGLTEEAFKKL